MAAPTATYVQLPTDTGNTGKKIRTVSRTVGSDTVHEHFFIPTSSRSKVGQYLFSSGLLTVQATAHNGTSTGFFWLQNPVGSAVKLAVKRLEAIAQISDDLTAPSIPRLAFALFTFTGTASGAQVSPAKHDSTDAAATGTVRTAVTGMTVTVGNIAWAGLPIVTDNTSAWIYVAPTVQIWQPAQFEDELLVLRAGEGLLCYQPDNGTTSDTRKWLVNGTWDEFE